MMPKSKVALIIGAGPAGLTAAYELLKRTDVKPIVFEASSDIGGISKTVNFKGNRIDIGGHRFFSKSDRVMEWWHNILPIESTPESESFTLKYQGKTRELAGGSGLDPEQTDDVMLVRSRLSRIFYGRKFYNYPITLEWQTLRNLGFTKLTKSGFSYVWAQLKPRKVNNLEDFYINRFGKELYRTFFEDYTEKVWGVPVSEIAADWGAQRVKGLSVAKTISHAVKKAFSRKKKLDISQKNTETSLIEYFLYPKLGPGHMWETVAKLVTGGGGEVHMQKEVTHLKIENQRVIGLEVRDTTTNKSEFIRGDYVFSTMPVNELIESIQGTPVPEEVKQIAQNLPFRDFITVGLLLERLQIKNETNIETKNDVIPDNWIYIQEPDVKVGRLQVFNNWSPYLVSDPNLVWVGMEYFVNEGDELWNKPDSEMAAFGIHELEKIGIISSADVVDQTVIRIKKTYPAYFGSYENFDKVQHFTDSIENLFLIGRNGQHRYNNQDHSMLTAIAAVDNVISGSTDKENIWSVNVEQEYHESK